MNARLDPSPEAASPGAAGTGRRLVPWLAVAVLVAVGVLLALRYGARVTPLLDGLR